MKNLYGCRTWRHFVILMYNTPYSSAMKNFLSIDFRIYLTTRLCRSRPVGRNTCSAYCCATHHIYLVKTRTSKHKRVRLNRVGGWVVGGCFVGGGWWVVGGGWWVVGGGSWVVGRGSWVVGRGSWVVGRGSWVVGRGSWVVGRGS